MKREIVKVDAESKLEAIAALEILLETIKSTDYDGRVIERVIIKNEEDMKNN